MATKRSKIDDDLIARVGRILKESRHVRPVVGPRLGKVFTYDAVPVSVIERELYKFLPKDYKREDDR